MRSIFVPLSGSENDARTVSLAADLALRMKAGLTFAHVPLMDIDIGLSQSHIQFAAGDALTTALAECRSKSDSGVSRFLDETRALCGKVEGWTCRVLPDKDSLLRTARYHDFILMRRSERNNPLPRLLLDMLVADSGRPILLVPAKTASLPCRSVAIWWKDHRAAARAVSAGLPIINMSKHITVMSVPEHDGETRRPAKELAKRLSSDEMEVEAEDFLPSSEPLVESLWSASLRRHADIVVMGAYSHWRARERLFGGCTQSVLEAASLPVLLLH